MCLTKDGQTTASASIPFAAGISVTGLATLNSAVVLNESGGDNDIRMESDTNASHFSSDAGLFAGVGAFAFGQAAANGSYVGIDPPAFTAAANVDIARLRVNNNAAITVPAGTTDVAASLLVTEPNLTATGTINKAATIYIPEAPTEGTANYAIYVGGGAVYLGGSLTCDGAVTCNARLNTVQGSNVASANNLALGADGNMFIITGTTQINLLEGTNWTAGSIVILRFTASLTVKHGQVVSGNNYPINLAGAADFSATDGDMLTLVLVGSEWNEISRTVI